MNDRNQILMAQAYLDQRKKELGLDDKFRVQQEIAEVVKKLVLNLKYIRQEFMDSVLSGKS